MSFVSEQENASKPNTSLAFYMLANNMGQAMCDVFVHALTRCDVTSKLGTKSAGIKADPSLYLKDFGNFEGYVPETLYNAEKNLV